jgi:hypothetical protein
LRARRFFDPNGKPRYVALYDLADESVVQHPEWASGAAHRVGPQDRQADRRTRVVPATVPKLHARLIAALCVAEWRSRSARCPPALDVLNALEFNPRERLLWENRASARRCAKNAQLSDAAKRTAAGLGPFRLRLQPPAIVPIDR